MRSFNRSLRLLGGFTLIELLTVMVIIAILAGLILSIAGFASKKGALARASAEIQALSAGCESYKADNGTYPHQILAVSGSIPTTAGIPPSDQLDPRTMGNSITTSSNAYTYASQELYEALTGDLSCSGSGGGQGVPNYISSIKPDVWGRSNMSAAVGSANLVYYLSDPFGNSYGYSTANATTVATGTSPIQGYTSPNMPGYNPTFDLWSTGGQTATPFNGSGSSAAGAPGDPALQWIKNW